MRIAINGWFHGHLAAGSGQYLEALSEWLPRVGEAHEIILVIPRGRAAEAQHADHVARREPNGTGNPHCVFHPASTPLDRLNANLAKLWFEQITFPLICRRLRADVAFVPYWGSPWWRPCPVAVTVHDLIPLLLPLYRGGALQRTYTALVRRSARRAAAVLTDSEASKRDIIARLGIPAERVHAIHLAADPRFQPVTDPAELARVRVRYGLPDAPFLLYLGGFDARKNVGRMIEAYARMRSGVRGQGSGVMSQGSVDRDRETGNRSQSALSPDPCPLIPGPWPDLVIAGRLPATDTAFTPDPRPVAERLGVGDCVHFVGWVDEADKPALYSLALATAFVSEYEGFGLPVLEAMACEPIRSV
jgi:glycosyltransferase involved in cell wall biosynthesis